MVVDDSSHYEVSLTAGQAFVAFVLLLLSLAASFAFGLMIGKGQMDDRLVVRRTPAVVSEASVVPSRKDARIVELGDTESRREQAASPVNEPKIEEIEPPAARVEPNVAPFAEAKPESTKHVDDAAHAAGSSNSPETAHETPVPKHPTPVVQQPKTAATPPVTSSEGMPHFAQVLSTSDVKTAENLAAKLIDKGFTSAYVERNLSLKGMVYRVRVRFGSEPEARASVEKLRGITNSDVWITK